MNYVILGLAFLGGFLLICGVNYVIADALEARRQEARRRLEEEFRLRQKERARTAASSKELYELAAEGYVELRTRATVRARFVKMVDEAGLLVPPQQLLLGSLMAGAGTGLLAGWISGRWVVGVAVAPVVMAVPLLYVAMLRARRMEKMLSQLPDAFDLMSRTMKAGQTISQALQAVADEFSPPIAQEFGYCYDQQNLGLSPEAALRDLARRAGLLELRIFVLAVMIHRQTGGNLASLLEKLSTVIRQRYRIRGAIKALTAEGRLQAIVLLALPIVMLLAMLVVNRSYAMLLFDYPMLLVGMFGFMAMGAFFIQRIINFDI